MVLGVIPARGGSKGVPRKNIKLIAGKPLIVWTIEAAQQSQHLDRFVVSTEDAEIAQIAERHGAEVLDRPQVLASDAATSLSVWQHALSEIPADVFVNLFPTSPIRDEGLIDRAIEAFEEEEVDSLATGFTCKLIPFGKGDDGRTDLHGRQVISGFFHDDGSVYVIRADVIRGGLQFGDRKGHLHTSRACNVEIDEPFDFWLAEQILLERHEC